MYVNQNQKFLLSLGVLKFLHPPDMLQDSYKQPTALADTLLYSLAGLLLVPGFVGVLSSLTCRKLVQLKGKKWYFFVDFFPAPD